MTKEDFIEQVKACGQSVIDNAEKIYNSFQFSTDGVQVMIDVSNNCIPEITVVKKFMPERFFESVSGLRGKHQVTIK